MKLENSDYNAFLLQVKVAPDLIKDFNKFKKKHGLNTNQALKKILITFFSNPKTND
tara:strand:- start:116 stop:283 length:168 start_codon:yes stop_codon:yes gene_type:complete